ncbi:MAG: hypothetical protein IJU57_02915 [Clostridia bacterium]|nr:hypothetical protein [Clostridia bacterium]
MEIRSFGAFLENALIKRGVSENTAKQRVTSLLDSLTEDDIKELQAINSQEGIKDITEKFIALLNENRKNAKKPDPEKPAPVSAETPQRAFPAAAPASDRPSAPKENPGQPSGDIAITEKKPAPAPQPKPQKPDPLDAYDISKQPEEPEPEPTERGRKIFLTALLVTLPVTLFLLAVMLIAFGAVFATLAAVSLAIVVAMVALIAAGSVISLVGIIYGFIQVFSHNVPVGLYEIGLSILIIGIVFLVSILMYNVAVRFIPWVMKKVIVLFKFVCKQLRRLFMYLRKECYKL